MQITNWTRAALAIAGLLAILALGVPTAHAQDEAGNTALARSLFQEGVGLARGEQYEEAADRFRRAYALRPAPAIAFNLASALAHLDRLVEASELLRQMLRAPDVTPELRSAAELQLEEIAPRLGRLVVRATGDLDGVSIQLDDRELASAAMGVAMPIDPGAHVARALRDGDEVSREEVQVAEGATEELTLAIPERAVEAPAQALRVEPVVDTPPGDDSGMWIGVGIGIAVVAIAGIVVTAVVLTQPGAPAAISGNTNPAVLEW